MESHHTAVGSTRENLMTPEQRETSPVIHQPPVLDGLTLSSVQFWVLQYISVQIYQRALKECYEDSKMYEEC